MAVVVMLLLLLLLLLVGWLVGCGDIVVDGCGVVIGVSIYQRSFFLSSSCFPFLTYTYFSYV